MESPAEEPPPPDLYRDTWVRYLGYANEVGESFRAIVPVSLVWASYGVATAYVAADAIDKGKKAAAVSTDHGTKPFLKSRAMFPSGGRTLAKAVDEGRSRHAAVAVVDTFIWQALASVAIPGFTINRICAGSLYLMASMTHWPLSVRKWATTAVGLSTIPFIIKPIDRSVDFLMDSSLRKLYKTEE
ncbi:mitochondrial fission process protein 1 isoform X1 [Zootoca vivipara]|uniref:mitochondrial fission process protein 1 isoform X1 n=1 Tax=Zootoca vivipara TaxID=8524 RepID=UPI00293BB71E|nr:mitochondrial fission process protein 1 isoform X1 [Zootoca vivipara]